MKAQIEAFLAEVDRELQNHARGETLDIFHIGRSSLVWRYGYNAMTTDIDVLMPRGASTDRLMQMALDLFGDGTPKARAHGLYLQAVHEDYPPTPAGYKERSKTVVGPWQVL